MKRAPGGTCRRSSPPGTSKRERESGFRLGDRRDGHEEDGKGVAALDARTRGAVPKYILKLETMDGSMLSASFRSVICTTCAFLSKKSSK